MRWSITTQALAATCGGAAAAAGAGRPTAARRQASASARNTRRWTDHWGDVDDLLLRERMGLPSVYSATMQMNGAPPTLLRRIVDLLRAKQFLVFYAIALTALDLAAPLLTGWLRVHHPLEVLVAGNLSTFGDSVVSHGAAVIAVAVAYFAVSSWFEAGFIRSLLGRLHWGPRDARQFRRLFALNVLVDALGWGITAAGGDVSSTSGQLAFAVWIVVSIALLYASIAIVVSDASVARAIMQSLRTVRANPAFSGGVGLLPFVVLLDGLFWLRFSGDFASVLPSVIIWVTVMGSVTFLVYAVLILVYVDAIEKRCVPHEP